MTFLPTLFPCLPRQERIHLFYLFTAIHLQRPEPTLSLHEDLWTALPVLPGLLHFSWGTHHLVVLFVFLSLHFNLSRDLEDGSDTFHLCLQRGPRIPLRLSRCPQRASEYLRRSGVQKMYLDIWYKLGFMAKCCTKWKSKSPCSKTIKDFKMMTAQHQTKCRILLSVRLCAAI